MLPLEPQFSPLHFSLGNSFGIWKTLAHFPRLKSVSRNKNNLLNYISDIIKKKIEFQEMLYNCRPYENEVKLISFLSQSILIV